MPRKFICCSMIAKAACQFQQIIRCVVLQSKNTKMYCFDRCASIFNQRREREREEKKELCSNNVNGIAVCHLSFRFQSFNLKMANIFAHFPLKLHAAWIDCRTLSPTTHLLHWNFCPQKKIKKKKKRRTEPNNPQELHYREYLTIINSIFQTYFMHLGTTTHI